MPDADRIKVTHILTKPELGGAQGNTLYTVQHLDRSRFAPGLITSPSGPLAAEMAAIPDAQVTFLPDLVREIRPFRDWVAARAMVRELRRTRPDIVHTHSSKAGVLGRWAARRAGVGVIVHTVHGFPFHAYQSPPKRSFYIALERAVAPLTDRFVCVSEADIAKGESHHVFSRDRATLIRSGICLEDCRRARGAGAEVRRELGIPQAAPLVGMVACFKPQKDPLAFVRVAQEIHRLQADAWFVMVGDGELRQAVEEARHQAGLSEQLVLAGWRRDVPRLMAAMNVVVLTSLHEGLPRVVPEAMACGRPVVATAVDGNPEIIRDGVTGHLVAPGDTAAAAERVLSLLRQPQHASAMGDEASRWVGEWDIDRMVRRQEEMYLSLLQHQGARP